MLGLCEGRRGQGGWARVVCAGCRAAGGGGPAPGPVGAWATGPDRWAGPAGGAGGGRGGWGGREGVGAEKVEDGEGEGGEGDERTVEVEADDMPMDGDADETSEGNQPWRPNQQGDDRNRQPSYKIFTQQFDETIAAEDLCDLEELSRLRQYLDQQLQQMQQKIMKMPSRVVIVMQQMLLSI